MAALNSKRIKHGHTVGGTPLWFYRWSAMMARCYNPKNSRFERYGGRGIKVCERWHDPGSFYADMGDAPPGMSLDRIDNDGPYSPENCRWADLLTQARNRPSVRLITHNGVTLNMHQWAYRIGIKQSSLFKRLKRWPLDRALETPAPVTRPPANDS